LAKRKEDTKEKISEQQVIESIFTLFALIEFAMLPC